MRHLRILACGACLVALAFALACGGAGSAPPRSRQTASPIAPSQEAAELAWYEGGTLATKTMLDWRRGDPRDRLATAADICCAILGREHTKENWPHLRPLAEHLVVQLNDIADPRVADAATDDQLRINKVAEMAAIIGTTWREGLEQVNWRVPLYTAALDVGLSQQGRSRGDALANFPSWQEPTPQAKTPEATVADADPREPVVASQSSADEPRRDDDRTDREKVLDARRQKERLKAELEGRPYIDEDAQQKAGAAQMRAERTRTWSDASGSFQVEATLIRVSAGKVILEKADGSTIEVPVEKLSEADQKWIRTQMRKR